MTRTIEQIDMEIAVLKSERAELLQAAKAPLNERIAILMHDHRCPHNHMDACGWHYEIEAGNVHNWKAATHFRWLQKSDGLIAQLGRIGTFDDDTIFKVAQATIL